MISSSTQRVTTIAIAFMIATGAFGSTFEPKSDNRIICVDLQTGALVWEHVPKKLSDAHFEWYIDGVIAYPHYSGDDRSNPIFLNAMSGKPIESFERDHKRLITKSAVFSPSPDIELDNGWRLTGFSPGNNKTLEFRDAGDKEQWRIPTDGYPHQVRAWGNFVFYAFSYLSDEGILYAYRAGEETPAWTLDLNAIVKDRPKPLTRMIFQIIDDRIYLESNEHIFCIQPDNGKLFWHRDLAEDLDLKFNPNFYGGALNLAVFAKSDNVLIISFERRVVALNVDSGKCLWHLQPDTFPHCPFPVVRDSHVVLTAGANRVLKQLPVGNAE